MADYPNINSGAVVAQFPHTEVQEFRSTVEEGECFQKYAYADRPSFALHRWELTYSVLTADEAADLLDFFALMGGRRGTFSFTAPNGVGPYNNCRFEQDRLDIQYVGPGQYSTNVIIQEHA